MTPAVDAAKLAAAEQTVAAYIATESQDGSSCHTSISSSGNTTWITAAHVSASAELAAELQAAMADKAWHSEGEALSASRQLAFCGSTCAAGCRQRCLLRLASECLVAACQQPPPRLIVYRVCTTFNF
jgi:hypothetical protein